MNTRACASLLRCFLCVLVIIKMTEGIVIIAMATDCNHQLSNDKLLPRDDKFSQRAYFMSLSLFHKILLTFGFTELVVGIFGIAAVIWLYKWKLLNFAFGLYLLLSLVILILLTYGLTEMSNTIVKTVVIPTKILFHSVNSKAKRADDLEEKTDDYSEASQMEQPSFTDNNTHKRSKRWTAQFFLGWDLRSEGDVKQHVYVDAIQLRLNCCGLTNREFWLMKTPRSCCNYNSGVDCILSIAHTKGCLVEVYDAINCAVLLRDEMVGFTLFTILAAISSLYLAYLRVLYPDGVYISPESSDNEDQTEEY